MTTHRAGNSLSRRAAITGYVAFGVGYRLFEPDTGENPWPAQLDDAQRAVRWVRTNAETYDVGPGQCQCAEGRVRHDGSLSPVAQPWQIS